MVGSKKPDLQAEAQAVLQSHHVHIEPEWISRKNNKTADYLSRIVDYDDWSLSQNTFRELHPQWGPHTIDTHYCPVTTSNFGTLGPRMWMLSL